MMYLPCVSILAARLRLKFLRCNETCLIPGAKLMLTGRRMDQRRIRCLGCHIRAHGVQREMFGQEQRNPSSAFVWVGKVRGQFTSLGQRLDPLKEERTLCLPAQSKEIKAHAIQQPGSTPSPLFWKEKRWSVFRLESHASTVIRACEF